jgi:hypothetical protein
MVNEAHARWRDRTLRAILARMRHDGCGGQAGNAELLPGAEGASSPAGAEDRTGRLTSASSATCHRPGLSWWDSLCRDLSHPDVERSVLCFVSRGNGSV